MREPDPKRPIARSNEGAAPRSTGASDSIGAPGLAGAAGSIIAPGHESSEPSLRPILHFAVILTLLSVVAFVLMRWMFVTEVEDARAADAPLPPLAAERMVPVDPRLQAMSAVPLVGATMPEGMQPFASTSLADFERKQNEMLESYGWVDRQAGIVRVPIERAIELTLKKGLPTAAPKTDKR